MKKLFLALAVFALLSGCQEKVEVVKHSDAKAVEQTKNKAQRPWKESPLFQSGSYTMLGENGRLGFIYDDSETMKFYPNKPQKYMWHFWGKDEEFDGDLKVMATHEKDGKQVTVLKGVPFAGPHNGADRHVPSTMSLPESGMWRLDAYIGDKLFGSVYIKVYE
ncbi:hypothetical protein [Anoxybacteroides tepidamans]|uniref:hypothetical protein n=1 Tax=Anoxybacteroides tepidamans TaxID=265948 RepID=UPI00048931B4|nr:hypothetical protein [Anoxybacillus tepidamans]